MVSVADLFGFDTALQVSLVDPGDLEVHVPAVEAGYCFDPDVTVAILAGFTHNRRVLLQGAHGTGKSSHLEQIAARLRWPMLRINLDAHITRMDLIGRDAVVIRDGQQVTEFQPGLLPWAAERPVALVFDELDAGRPDVMFVLQRVLEREGRLTLLDQNRVIEPHDRFRLFATANTIGLGDQTGLYHGTQMLNQAQVDRWDIVARLGYLSADAEAAIVRSHVPHAANVEQMVAVADMTRHGFAAGDISTLMSPRTVIAWAQNTAIFGDLAQAFALSFVNKCDVAEHDVVSEYFQRAFGSTPDEQ